MSKQIRIWYVVSINTKSVPEEPINGIENFCFELGCSGVEAKDNSLDIYFDGTYDIEAIKKSVLTYCTDLVALKLLPDVPDITVNKIDESDWAENWKEHFKPVKISARLSVVPPWYKTDPEEKGIRIVIEPGMAFGTGGHLSTEIALILLDRYLKKGMKVWDIGSGTGILAVTAVKLGASYVYAIDNDEYALEASEKNINLNEVSSSIRFDLTGIETADNDYYDLVIANINRTVILGNADRLIKGCQKNGIVILSGLELTDEGDVMQTFKDKGFSRTDRESRDSWLGLVFRKMDENHLQ